MRQRAIARARRETAAIAIRSRRFLPPPFSLPFLRFGSNPLFLFLSSSICFILKPKRTPFPLSESDPSSL
ncbi:hypothetical protein VNO77_00504 [Canavalia gladiata]|uniref:Uncharacterized protein n=1 Tax=Canavalia gladiata TaxID=3824 RepID=A0AAN9MR98_CANGL